MKYLVVIFICDIRSMDLQRVLSGIDAQSVVFICSDSEYEFIKSSVMCSEISDVRSIIRKGRKYMCMNGGPDPYRTAVSVAHALYSECLVVADRPFKSSNEEDCAVVIDKIDFDEVLEIMSSGYEILPYSLVEYAKQAGVLLRVRPWNDVKSETEIKEVMGMEGSIIKGVICEPDMCVFTLRDILDVPGISYRIFKTISDRNIVVDIISLPAAVSGKQDISFSVLKEDKFVTLQALKDNQEELGFTEILVDDNVAKVSIVGAALQTASGVATAMFKVLYENGINVKMINTSDIKIAVIIDRKLRNLAVHKLHDAFIESSK